MAFTREQLERYSRNFVLKEIGVAGQKRLMHSRVLVAGAGGLGSSVLVHLASSGVGLIGIADGDRVSLSNLQRQFIHRTENTGIWKVDSAVQMLESLNPDPEYRIYRENLNPLNIMDIIRDYDFVVDCTDRFAVKFLINDACILAGIPYSHAGITRFSGQSMTWIPGAGPCLRCLLPKIPDPAEAQTCADVGVLSSCVGVIGSIQATEAVKYLTGAGDLLTGRLLSFDGLRMDIYTTPPMPTDPDCAVCGSQAVIHSVEENREEYETGGLVCSLR